MSKPTFVLNDENVTNSYGFRVRNEGIALERFRKNPVILNDHWNGTSSVLGKWDNIRIEGSRLLADAEFDMEDDAAKKIAGKVDRGYIKGCSMGITFNREYMKANPDGSYELDKSELMEGSIVAVPANAEAIKLYAVNGQLMDEKEVRLSLQNFQTEIDKNKPMEKYNLSANALTALGLANADDATAVSTAITALKADLDKTKAKLTALEAEAETKAKDQANALVDGAIAAGKLTADLKDSFVQMAIGNYAMAAKVIGAMPAKKSLGAQVANSVPSEVKTEEDFAKLSFEQQLAFKEGNPEGYKKIFG